MNKVLTEIRPVEEYAKEINGYAVKTAEIIFKMGETFNKAKANLPHGEFSKLFDLTPIGQRTAQRYMKIANSVEVKQLLKNDTMSHLNAKQLYDVATETPPMEAELSTKTDDELFNLGANAQIAKRMLSERNMTVAEKKQALLDRVKLEELESRIEENIHNKHIWIIRAKNLPPEEFKQVVEATEITKEDIDEAMIYKELLANNRDKYENIH